MDTNDNTSLTSRAQNKGVADLSSASGVRPKKSCYAPIKHNRLRRKNGHDYAGVCIYLISVNVANRQRLLGTLVGNTPDEAHIEPSPLGEYIAAAFRNMADIVTAKTGSCVQVLQYQIMPDHFHGILYVRDPLPDGWNLARMIAAWKGDCSREYWRISSSTLLGAPDVRPEKSPLFEPNFNDKYYLALARSGAILVSPFISPAEKAVYEACYKEKLRMIRIVNRGLDGQFIYPTGRDLKGCSDGFLLIMAPYSDFSPETAATRISRARCLDMNAYAADLSTVIAPTRDAHNTGTRA